MLITEFVDITITSFNKKRFEELGYNIFVGQVLTIPVNHLSKGSHVIVEVKCDYCGEIFQKAYKEYLGQIKNINKNSCVKCSKKKKKNVSLFLYGTENPMQSREVQNKLKNTMLEKYGVEYGSQTEQSRKKVSERWKNLSDSELKEIQEKMKQTCLNRYGVDNYAKTKECQAKRKETCLEKYGVEHPLQNQEIIEKIKQTCLDKYGTENVFQNEDIKENIRQTNIDKYGVEYYSQTDEFKIANNEYWDSLSTEELNDILQKREQTCLKKYGVKSNLQLPEVREKANKTLLQTDGIPTSSQQIEIYKTIKTLFNEDNVFLNYPFDYYILDIAIISDKLKIDVEYDGWYWHSKKNDNSRNSYLKNRDWKVLRIKSGHKLPTIEELKDKLKILIETNEMYQEIVLDDWKDKEVAV